MTVRLYNLVVTDVEEKGADVEDWGALGFGAFCTCAPAYIFFKQYCRMIHLVKKLHGGVQIGRRMRMARQYYQTLIGLLNVLVEVLQSVTAILFAVASLRLIPWLWDGRIAEADHANDVGAAGFFLFVALLNSWVPADTRKDVLPESIAIKGGHVPVDGVQAIEDDFCSQPLLGLSADRHAVHHAVQQCSPSDLEQGHEDDGEWREILEGMMDFSGEAPAAGYQLADQGGDTSQKPKPERAVDMEKPESMPESRSVVEMEKLLDQGGDISEAQA